jgi:uncharacterized protein YjbJ (UPF0337 family)
MDKNRIEGASKQAKGTLKVVAGKLVGNDRLVVEGESQKAVGEIQSTIGRLKDVLPKK